MPLLTISNLRLPDVIAQHRKINLGILLQNLLHTFFCLPVQSGLFQIDQQKENVQPPANCKQEFFIWWELQKAFDLGEHLRFVRLQIAAHFQKQIDDMLVHIETVHWLKALQK